MSSSSSSIKLEVVDYTDKSIVVFGVGGVGIDMFHEILTSAGGKSNRFRYGETASGTEIKAPGFVFAKGRDGKKAKEVADLVAQINSGKIEANVQLEPPKRTKALFTSSQSTANDQPIINREAFMNLMSRVEALEAEVGILRAQLEVNPKTLQKSKSSKEPIITENDLEYENMNDDSEETVLPSARRLYNPANRK